MVGTPAAPFCTTMTDGLAVVSIPGWRALTVLITPVGKPGLGGRSRGRAEEEETANNRCGAVVIRGAVGSMYTADTPGFGNTFVVE